MVAGLADRSHSASPSSPAARGPQLESQPLERGGLRRQNRHGGAEATTNRPAESRSWPIVQSSNRASTTPPLVTQHGQPVKNPYGATEPPHFLLRLPVESLIRLGVKSGSSSGPRPLIQFVDANHTNPHPPARRCGGDRRRASSKRDTLRAHPCVNTSPGPGAASS